MEAIVPAVASTFVGGLLGGGGGGGSTTSTVDRSPWAPAQPYLLGSTSSTGGTRQLRAGATPTGYQRQRVLNDSTGEYEWQQVPQYDSSAYETVGGTTTTTPGVLPGAVSQYAAGQWAPEQQAAVDAYMPTMAGQNSAFGSLASAGSNLLQNGVPSVANAQTNTMTAVTNPYQYGYTAHTAQPNTVANVAQGTATNSAPAQGYDAATGTASTYDAATGTARDYQAALADVPDSIKASTIGQAAFANATNAGAQQVGTTPRDANINALLAGDYNNPYLDQQINSATRRLTDNFNEQVLPGIGQSATMAGQYGGSRHGIAEGLAAKGLAQSLGDMTGSMYGNAYNQGFGARTALTGQLIGTDTQRDLTGAQLGTQVSLANASNATQTALANAAAANAQKIADQQAQQQAAIESARLAAAAKLQNAAAQTSANAGNAAATNSMNMFNAGAKNQAGAQNAAAQTGISQFNAGAENTANQFAAGATNANNQFNAGLDTNMSQFNAGQTNSLGLANAGMLNTMGQFNAGAQNTADQWTAGNSTQNAQFNATAQNNANATNMQANNNMSQFNANLGLANNAQNVNSMTTAGNLLNAGASGQNAAFGNTMNALNMPNAQNQANLTNYANIVNATAGQGGVQSQSNPYFTNPMGNALGLASAGVGLYSAGQDAGLWGNSTVPTSPNTAAAFGANPVMNFGQSGYQSMFG